MITQAFVWIETRLDEGAWARRFYLVAATVMTWQVVKWSQHYAELALAAKADMLGTAGVIGAVAGVAGGIQTFAFKHYLGSREAA